jgi:hypothetical protein
MTAEHQATGPHDTTAESDDADGADRVREGVGHLQNAALEIIAAARVLLDAAEEAVGDPTSAAGLFAALGDLARSAQATDPDAAGGGYDGGHQNGDDGGVQRIRVT